MVQVLVLFAACDKVEEGNNEPDYPVEVFIENDELKLGINTRKGGAITYLARKDDNVNLVNNADLGRQIQISFYAFPVPYAPGGQQPHPRWTGIGWNPIQAGDVAGNGSEVLDLWYEGDSLYVSCIPMHWPLDNVPGECIYESRIKLKGNQVHANVKILNDRPDKTQYRARNNEFPAVYTNGTHYKLYSYTGSEPFSDDALTLIPKRIVAPGEFPWSKFYATESWAALVNDDGKGLGVYSPETDYFLGGFVGVEGSGGTNDGPTGYISPVGNEILDYNIEFAYDYVLVTGMLDDIRDQVLALTDTSRNPSFDFSSDRQDWWYINFHDPGWPVTGELQLTPDQYAAHLVGPERTFFASNNKTLVVNAAFQTTASKMVFMWTRLGDEAIDEGERSASIDIINDGNYHEYRISLDGVANYDGLITSIRLFFRGLGSQVDLIKVKSIYFE